MTANLKPAPFGVRFGAYVIDLAAYFIVTVLADQWLKQGYPGMDEKLQALTQEFVEMGGRGSLVGFFGQMFAIQGSYLYLSTLVSGLVMAAFFLVPEALWGLSLGKRTLGLQIVNRTDGGKLGLVKRSAFKNAKDWVTLLLIFPLMAAGLTGLGFVLSGVLFLWSIVLLIFMLMATGEGGLTPYDRWTGTGVYRKRDLATTGDVNTL